MKPARLAPWVILFQAVLFSPISWVDPADGAFALSSPEGAFSTMDRLTGGPQFGLDLGYTGFTGNLSGFRGVRMEIYAQGVTYNGEGWYFAVAASRVSDDAGEDFDGIGNTEVGTFVSFSKGPVSGVVRFGLTLPTSSDDLEGITANFLTSFFRLTDLSSTVPETVWFRFSASPVYQRGRFVSQVDLGIDFPFFTPVYIEVDPWIRFNIGMGVKLGTVAFLGELVTLGTKGTVQNQSDRFLETLGATVRVQSGGIEPGLSFIVPINARLREINPWLLLFSVRSPI